MKEFSSDGHCLCGAVRFQISASASDIGLCHCKMCRRWSGGLPLTVIHAQVVLEESETLAWWKSSEWGERGFCNCCGTPLFWRLQGDAGKNAWEVSVGALTHEEPLKIVQHIFYDEKAAFYETADDAERLGGVEFTAQVMKSLSVQHGKEVLRQALGQMRRHSGDVFADAVEKLL